MSELERVLDDKERALGGRRRVRAGRAGAHGPRRAGFHRLGRAPAPAGRRGAGPFSVSTAVQSASTDAAAREILLEVERMRETDVSDGELSLATSYLAGVFPIRYETTSAIATALANLVIYGLPDNFYDSYRAKIRAQTAADIRRVARAHLHPERVQLVVVGDPSAVRSPLEELGIGPVTVYNDTGETIAA